MKRYRLAPEALADIDEIVTFIARDSSRNALVVWDRLEETFTKLAEHPGMGHVRAELRDDSLRVASVYDYLVIYDPAIHPIVVLRVIHGARNLRRLKLTKRS